MRRLAPVVLAALVALSGCGGPSPELFEVERSGRYKNANVTLTVSDGGTVACNGGEPTALDAEQLLEARALARGLEAQAALAISLPAEKNSNTRYSVRTSAGTVAFSDTSRGRTPEFNRLIAFSADVTENVCKLER